MCVCVCVCVRVCGCLCVCRSLSLSVLVNGHSKGQEACLQPGVDLLGKCLYRLGPARMEDPLGSVCVCVRVCVCHSLSLSVPVNGHSKGQEACLQPGVDLLGKCLYRLGPARIEDPLGSVCVCVSPSLSLSLSLCIPTGPRKDGRPTR